MIFNSIYNPAMRRHVLLSLAAVVCCLLTGPVRPSLPVAGFFATAEALAAQALLVLLMAGLALTVARRQPQQMTA